jgi:hypothetical protein
MLKFWKEIIFFSIIATVYFYCTAPGYTWSNLDNDCFNFVYAAKFFGTPHVPGYPSYVLPSILAIRFPWGMDGWKMAFFMSSIPALLSCIFIFLAVKKQTTNKWSPYIASISLAGCNLFMSQSVIIDVYSFCIMAITASYLAYVYKKEKTLAILLGFVIGTHPILFPVGIAMGIMGVRKRYWWIPFVIAIPLYVYCLAQNPAYGPFVPSAFGQFFTQCGDIMLSDLPNRLRDTVILLCCGFGLAIIPAFLYLKNFNKTWLLWLGLLLPATYWMFNATEVTMVHLLLGFPFIAIAAGLGMDQVKIKPIFIFAVSFILLIIMPFFYAVGRTCDENLGAQSFYDQLKTIKDGHAFTNVIRIDNTDRIGLDERCSIALWIIDKESKKNIIDLSVDKYMSLDENGEKYRQELRDDYGVSTPVFAMLIVNSEQFTSLPMKESPMYSVALAFAESNPNLDVYYSTIPEDRPMERILTKVVVNE